MHFGVPARSHFIRFRWYPRRGLEIWVGFVIFYSEKVSEESGGTHVKFEGKQRLEEV